MKKALKRSLSLLLAITIIFVSAYVGFGEVDFDGVFAIESKAATIVENGTCGVNLTWTLDDEGTLIISGTGNMPTYSTWKYVPWYSSRLLIKNAIIKQGVTNIGIYAFADCTNLVTITIPDSVTSIEYAAFYDCASLTSITIPDSVTSIGELTFSGCHNITSFIIPDGVKSIEGNTFRDCSKLTSVTIPDSVTSIGSFAFYDCIMLSPVVIPDSVVNIESDVFFNTPYYNDLSNWENDVLYVGKHLIEAKKSINGHCTVKPGTKTIAAAAFNKCTELESIIIPDSVINIGYSAFFECSNLTSIIISNNITRIGSAAFYGTGYYNDSSNWENEALYIDEYLIEGERFLSDEFIIKNGTKTIADSACFQCYGAASIVIPESITNIGKEAFYGCGGIEEVYYKGSETDRSLISILSGNEILLEATWHYAKVSKPETPKVTTSNEIGGVKVSWNNIVGATKYVVFRRQAGSSSWVNIGSTTSATLLDKNVKSGIYYCYSVRAYNSAGQYSDFVGANTQTRKFMATPKLTTIYNHVNGLAIKWNAVAGVTKGYRVYRRGAGSTYWTYLGTTKNLYFIDSQVKNKSGEYFRYTVIADGDYHSKFDTTGLYLRRLANPTLNSAVSSKTGITVKWGAVKGTTGYYVYRKTANSTWTRVGTVGGTNNTTFLDKTAKKGVTYTYTVKAVYGATTSAYNTGISCKDKY